MSYEKMSYDARSDYWPHGSQQELADLTGSSVQHINDILHRRKGVSKEMAMRLSNCCEDTLGIRISWDVFLFNKTTRHPALFGEPVEKLDSDGGVSA